MLPGIPWMLSKFMPTSELAPSPFAAITATSSSPDLEWIEHLKKAYPDPSTMPEDTKLLIEKADREHGRVGIKNLHQATKYLGKAKKHLAEVTEQRRAHRSQWMAHLAAGISMWESQLKDFRKHQTLLTDQANRARTEVTATNLIIQQLSSQAAGGTNPPNLPAPSPTEVEDLTEDAIEKKEEALRQKLQGVLKRCAGSLGLEISSSKARRGDGGGRKGGCCGQASQAATLIRAICHYAKVKLGRVEEVLSNSSHEANEVIVPEFVVGVSDSWDIVSPILLPWSHSILAEPRFVSPFKAAINALCLQWEVCTDRLHDGALQLSPSPLSRSSPSSLCKLSQRPQSNSPFQKRVCFVDHIDILLGDDEVLDMNLITVPHATLLHWKTKPWSKKRIRKTNNDDNKLTESFCLEPLSTQAVLSRQLDGETHYRDDDSTFVQISTWKHEANNPNDVTLAGAFTEGQGIPQGLIQQDSASEAELGNSDGSDASIDSHPEIHPPSSVGNRQEAILFHLRDEPIRTFLEWTEYDQMIAEIAFHYSVNPSICR